MDARIDINRSESKILPNKIVVIGSLHKQIFYVDVCTNAVWEMSLDEPFTTFVEAKGVKPGMNVSYMKRVEHVDVTNQGPIPAPEEVCPPAVYVPENFKWKQTAIIEIRARVTETREIEVVTDILRDGQPLPCPDEDDETPSIRFYVIQPGDTLFKIAKRYGTTVEAILELNPGLIRKTCVSGSRSRSPVPSRELRVKDCTTMVPKRLWLFLYPPEDLGASNIKNYTSILYIEFSGKPMGRLKNGQRFGEITKGV